MILIKNITIKDFLSHDDTVFEFNESEKLLIDGKSGSGKSSITEAILWCLYGKGRSDNKSLVRRGAKTASVSCKFKDGDLETVITRTTTLTSKNTLVITQNTGSQGQFIQIERNGIKDAQDWIEKEFLKASYELFTNSIAYPQDNDSSFVKSNASKRKDLLLEIIQAGNFDSFYEKTKETINKLELNTNIFRNDLKKTVEDMETAKNVADSYDQYNEIYTKADTDLKPLREVEVDLTSKISNISKIGSEISVSKTQLKSLSDSNQRVDWQLKIDGDKVDSLKMLNMEMAKQDISIANDLEKELEKSKRKIEDNLMIQNKINQMLADRPMVHDYTREIDDINKRLIPLINETGKCPAGDKCPFVIPIKGQIDFLTEQIEIKQKSMDTENEALKKWEEEFLKLPKVEDLTLAYGEIRTLETKIKTLRESQKIIDLYEQTKALLPEIEERKIKLLKEKEDNEKSIKDLHDLIEKNEKILVEFNSNNINMMLSQVRAQIVDTESKKTNANVYMIRAKDASEMVKKLSERLVGLNKDISKEIEDIECLEVLKEAFSPRGIKAVVIDYLVPQLEERINSILEQMSDFRIRIDTQKPKSDDDGVKEGLFITVINDRQEELAFSNYSGGEKVKITIAISEALSSLMNKIGFRLMDENIVSLDRDSTEGFVSVLEKLQDKFPQLLLISHLQEVKDIFENKVEIIKINGISKIIK